jgi:hypothetical protein
MIRMLSGTIALTFFALCGFGQQPGGFKAYKNQEEYCRENPKMPTCIDGRQMGEDLRKALDKGLYKPPTGPVSTGGATRTTARPQQRTLRTDAGPAPEVALQDWQFSHLSPAILASINIKSLLQSPIWTTLFSAYGVQFKAGEMENVRSALSDIGLILVSVSPGARRNLSTLMLARGNVDGPFGALLRSGDGVQSKRLNAFTMLAGDADSLEMASHRMQSKFQRTTSNTLQQTATLEALKYDAWIGLDPRLLSSLAARLGGGSSQAMAMLTSQRSLSLGLYLRDQIRIEAQLEASSPELAERMLAAYRQAEAKEKEPAGTQVWAAVEGAKLKFTAIMAPNQLKLDADFDDAAKMIGPQLAPLIQALAGLASAPRLAGDGPPKAQQGTIVIQGLAGGPKELPAK